jgi:hypothetical protein
MSVRTKFLCCGTPLFAPGDRSEEPRLRDFVRGQLTYLLGRRSGAGGERMSTKLEVGAVTTAPQARHKSGLGSTPILHNW